MSLKVMKQALLSVNQLEKLKSWKAVELQKVAKECGFLSSGTKAEVAQRIFDGLLQGEKPCRSVISFDLGYKNLAFCHVNQSSSVLEWRRTDLQLVDFHPSSVAPIVRSFIKEQVQNSIAATDAIVVERQRARSFGGNEVFEHTLRVNSVESMLWIALHEAAEKENRSDIVMVAQNRQSVDATWAEELKEVVSLNPARFSKAKVGGTWAKKQAAVALVQHWIDEEEKSPIRFASKFKERFSEESKKDDMSDCLMQAAACIFLFTCLLLFVLYCVRLWIVIYWNFITIKLSNSLLDRGFATCGTLRKQPILYVQDTLHAQLVWETNCHNEDQEMSLIYWTDLKENHIVADSIKSQVLDSTHTVYKATIGPIDSNTPVHYSIQVIRENRFFRRRVLAENTFQWHAKVDDQRDPIRIAAFSDNQFGMLSFLTLLQQVKRVKPHYLLHAGDAVQNYPSLRQWQTDFAAPLSAFGLGQSSPMIYAHGNHDFDPDGMYTYTRSGEQTWFSFTLANDAIHFIVLDSNLDWETQDEWLQRETETDSFKNAQFRIVVVHVPPFLEYWDPEAWFQLRQSEWSAFVKDRFVPIFERSKVDLVISGHQHNYERGERNGINYAIIGGAGGDLDFEQVKDWGMYEAKLFDFHFVVLEFHPINNGTSWELQWITYDIHGQKADATIIKPRLETIVHR
ncbi:Metallo-dependent phosphatase-like protein [Sporodiniella umbellata]|nr:Metallo-dependent phosphatase-like protein [Sporodiniella umbellata]